MYLGNKRQSGNIIITNALWNNFSLSFSNLIQQE